VAVINLVCLVVLRLFSKKNEKGKPSFAVTLSTVLLSLVTVALCATAISQMAMYVSAYGLTRLRLYALWFMALLALFFLLIVLCRVIPKIPFAPVAIPLFFLCFALLALPDSDAVIARHNYNCYLKDSTAEFDLNYMEKLGPSAVPTLCKIAEKEDPSLQAKARLMLAEYESNKEFSIKKLSLPMILANAALDGLDEKTRESVDRYKDVYFTDAPIKTAKQLYSRYFSGKQNATIKAHEVADYLSEEAEQQYFKPYNKEEVSNYFNCFYDHSGKKWRIDGIQTDVNASQRAFYSVKEVTPGTPKDGFVLYVYLELPRTPYTEAPENATLYTLIYDPT
jgi:hypothetical protein